MVSERLVRQREKWKDHEPFTGQPKLRVLALARLYGFDIIVIPTRSFDRDIMDRGIFSGIKAWIRARPRRCTTAKGLLRLWEMAVNAVVTPELIAHCQYIPP